MLFNIIDLNKRINTLENENEMLREIIKDELYKDFIKTLCEPDIFTRTKEENKRLRLKIKELKGIINEYDRKQKTKTKRNTR